MYCPATRYGSWCHACLVSCGFKQLNVLFGRTFITRVNCICAIIIIPYLKRITTSRVTTPVLLQFTYYSLFITRTLGARCAPYHLSKQLNISISKVMKCDNWHAWYMIIIQHKITAYSNNTSLIC